MSLLFNELLKIKTHVGKKIWNSHTSFSLEGLRPSQRLFGNPFVKKLNSLKHGALKTKREKQSIQQPFRRLRFLKKRSHFVIFNLEKTLSSLSQSLIFIQKTIQTSFTSQKYPHILFVSGKLSHSSGNFYLNFFQSFQIFKQNQLTQVKISFLQNQWVGGMFTNWKQVSESLRIYSKFKEKFEGFLFKHNIQFPIYEKYKKKYFGLTQLANTLPDLIIVTNPEDNEILIQEAFLLKIPIIGLVNSNTSSFLLEKITYPVPGNNQSPYFIYFCVNLFVLAIYSKTNKKLVLNPL